MEKEVIIDLNTATIEEIQGAIAKLNAALAEKQDSVKRDAAEQIMKLAEMAGLDVSIEGLKVAKKQFVAAKYKNPSNDSTWTGRGRKPNWVVEYLNAGGVLADIEIK